MKNKIWFLLALVLISRMISLWLLKSDAAFVLLPRSFTGRGVFLETAWLDLAIPFLIIMILWSARPQMRIARRDMIAAVLEAVGLLVFPLLTGLALYLYVKGWLLTSQLTWFSTMSWFHFIAVFFALNLFIDSIHLKKRWRRRAVSLLVVLAVAGFQDLLMADAQLFFISIISSVGMTLAFTVLAFRPIYRQSPSRAILAAAVVGAILCFFAVAVSSDSYFTIFLPSFSLLIGAIAMRSPKQWPRWAALGGSVAIALFLSIGLPRILPPDLGEMLDERTTPPEHSENFGSMTVNYDDPRVVEVAKKLARVLEAAMQVSQETFGLSPRVKQLTVRGIAGGGFYADFPDKIAGNLISERFIDLAQDSTFLNDPNRSIHFPDPVISILHEYSHLYGIVSYWPWFMGAEEEGWATYAATRLALRLYEKYGSGLWEPPYNYAAQARAITESNLAGHPVIWSHPNEFGGFRLWHALGKRDGEKVLFRHRWQLTRRDARRWLMMISEPRAARKMAETMNFEQMQSLLAGQPVSYEKVFTQKDLEIIFGLQEKPKGEISAWYQKLSRLSVNPAIKVQRSSLVLDLVLTFSAVLLAVGFKIKMGNGGLPEEST
ncbi:MAG: hypothetical protein ACE5I1_09045 [bacterium]